MSSSIPTESIKTSMLTYFEQVQLAMSSLDMAQLGRMITILLEAHQRGATIYIFGNGGSASTASHFANDLAKGCNVPGQVRFRAISLTDNVALMTAWANDTSYDNIFAEPLAGLVRPDDIVIGISGSGNSPNVLKGIEFGRAAGAYTIGLCGYGGGKLCHQADLAITTDCMVMEQVEDVHMTICHNVTTTLRSLLALGRNPATMNLGEPSPNNVNKNVKSR